MRIAIIRRESLELADGINGLRVSLANDLLQGVHEVVDVTPTMSDSHRVEDSACRSAMGSCLRRVRCGMICRGFGRAWIEAPRREFISLASCRQTN